VKASVKILRTRVLFAFVALLAKGVSAQTPPTYSVSVTEPYELIEEISTIRRIDREEIEARNARTLDEALRLVPGIYVRTGGDGTPRIDVRGFRSRHVLLLMNGVQINSTSDGQFDPARISTDSIRDIKISYGSSSVLYGDNALAAVIEITTVDEAPNATANVSAGTPDQWAGGGQYARTLGKWSITASATGFTTEGFRLPDSLRRPARRMGANAPTVAWRRLGDIATAFAHLDLRQNVMPEVLRRQRVRGSSAWRCLHEN
jgi:outer membrane receptor protein involved in Fe transport